VIEARALAKSFGAHPALRDVDLTVGEGELFALIGPDGAGKTTFFRLVAGLITPTSGTVRRSAEATFGLVPQRFALYEDLTRRREPEPAGRPLLRPGFEAASRAAGLLARVGMARYGAGSPARSRGA
jgi:ABC-type multidrug transport system ATPase subunit